MRSVRVLLTATAMAVAFSATSAFAAPADDHVPVANDDAVTLWAGSSEVLFDVLANDTDADGHQDLAICRFGEAEPRDWLTDIYREDFEGAGMVHLDLDPHASGTYTVGYQACDYSYLVPATLTVTVNPVGVATVAKVPDHPRQVRVTNPDQHDVWFLWGPVHAEDAEGWVKVLAGSSRTVTAGSRRIAWFTAFSEGDTPVYTGWGRVRGLEAGPARPSVARAAPPPFPRPGSGHHRAAYADPVDPTAVEPPVTGDEEVTRWAGSMGHVPVLANDSDPAGQPLDVCRIAPSGRDVSGFVEEWNGRFRLDVSGRSEGTYAVTYYACNQSRLAPGTVTVHVRRARHLLVSRTDRGGHLRLVNRNPEAVRVDFIDYSRPDAGLTLRVPADSERLVRVPSRFQRWYASIGHPAGSAGWGLVPGADQY